MQTERALRVLIDLARPTDGVFRGVIAVGKGIARRDLARLAASGLVERVLPDTYRLSASARSQRQEVRAALLWAGDRAAATGRSAARLYGLEGIGSSGAEIVAARSVRVPPGCDVVVHVADRRVVMPRRVGGLPCSGVEFTLLRLAAVLDPETFEIAFEDARRRRLTSVSAIESYLDRVAAQGRPGVHSLRAAVRAVDPVQPSRSTLEVKSRRLLEAHGIRGFVREHPLTWNGRTYRYDFAFLPQRVILETNGRRWHDDPRDYEHDQEKWSIPGRLGWRIVLATWDKVVRRPDAFVAELRSTLAR